ncbi:hypothetical protein G3A43_07760 [Paraburkholderia aspalathi]|nr:hypothetical protein [Paraburkholderia aspalathi]MBK3780151.1 hypothetical protein [Paraburkholderia aspalathi]
MKKAYLTVVVSEVSVKDVIEHIKDLDRSIVVDVLAEGDIAITGKDLSSLTNEIWLHDVEGHGVLALVKDDTATTGRILTADELGALEEFGVCMELKADYPNASEYGTPVYAIYDAAAMAEASRYGFDVAEKASFKTNFTDTGDDASERRWLRIRTPAWVNFAATLE